MNIVIVGSGLAGISCAAMLLAAKPDSKITIYEKENTLFGNSNLASSGICFPINDNDVSVLIDDIIKSGKGDKTQNKELVAAIVNKAAYIRDIFLRSFNIEFNEIIAAGGHSVPRIYRRNDLKTPIGNYIIMNIFDKIKDRVTIKTGVTISSGSDFTIKANGVPVKYDRLILCSGGNGYQYAKRNGFKTTNRQSASIEYLFNNKYITKPNYQIHPTTFVSCKSDNTSRNIIVPEILRGLGAKIVQRSGESIFKDTKINELSKRDELADYIDTNYIKKSIPIYILFDETIAQKLGPHSLSFYLNSGCIKKNTVGLYYGEIMPAIHFTMSGYIVDKNCKLATNIYVAGESIGTIHGKNRLAGVSLLSCIACAAIITANL